jgi:hypothetical protein
LVNRKRQNALWSEVEDKEGQEEEEERRKRERRK